MAGEDWADRAAKVARVVACLLAGYLLVSLADWWGFSERSTLRGRVLAIAHATQMATAPAAAPIAWLVAPPRPAPVRSTPFMGKGCP